MLTTTGTADYCHGTLRSDPGGNVQRPQLVSSWGRRETTQLLPPLDTMSCSARSALAPGQLSGPEEQVIFSHQSSRCITSMTVSALPISQTKSKRTTTVRMSQKIQPLRLFDDEQGESASQRKMRITVSRPHRVAEADHARSGRILRRNPATIRSSQPKRREVRGAMRYQLRS